MKPKIFLAVFLGLFMAQTVFSGGFLPEIAPNEQLKLKTEKNELIIETLVKTQLNGKYVYEITSVSANGIKLLITLNMNMTPVEVIERDQTGHLLRHAEYAGLRVHLTVPDKHTDKWIGLPPATYDQQTLFYVLRGFPFAEDQMAFDLLLYDGRLARVNVRNLGLVTVAVNGKKIRSYNLELKSVGLASFIYTGRFFFLDHKPYTFLRYEDSGGKTVENIGYET